MARARQPTDAERGLWRAAMRDVRLLHPSEPEAAAALPPSAPPPAPADPPAPRPAQPATPSAASRTRTGREIDAASARRLARGQWPLDLTLDLHGLARLDARDRLIAVLTSARNRGARCVLVITGKGTANGPEGVLRRSLPGWLDEPPLAAIVLSWRPAQPRDGGGGAFYVLLRRQHGAGS